MKVFGLADFSWNRGWLAVMALVAVGPLAPPLRAALPQAFQQQQEARSVLPHVRRPAQDTLEKLEDAVIQGKSDVFQFFDNISLQNTLDRGAELRLKRQLTEDFFSKARLFELDTVFFREALSRLHIQYRGTNIVAKRLVKGRPEYIQAETIALDVDRRLTKYTQQELANGAKPSARYHITASFRVARSWENGQWGQWRQEIPIGDFELVVYPVLDQRDRVINDGQPKRELLSDFGLAVMLGAEFPSAPVAERFPLQRRLEGMTDAQKLSALDKLARADDAEAQYLLGLACERGERVPASWDDAQGWYRRSAAQKFEPALYRLAQTTLLRGNQPGAADPQAMAFLNEAVNRGHVPSLALLGWVLVQDHGLPGKESANIAKGKEYLEYAAREGEPLALYTVAERALRGTDTSLPASEAVQYLQQAASKRWAPAAYFLGELSQKGQVIPKNLLEAWKWFFLAARWADTPRDEQIRKKAAQSLLALRDPLSEDQIEEALKSVTDQQASSSSFNDF